MKNVWVFASFLTLLKIILVNGQTGLEVNRIRANYEEVQNISLNLYNESVLIYPSSSAINPYRVKAWSDDVKADLPVLLVVKQATQVTSWTVPEMIETTQSDKILRFYNTTKTMCHDNMDKIVNPTNPSFSVGPLVVSQTFLVALSTSSLDNVTVHVVLEEDTNFYLKRNVNYSVNISPSEPGYKCFLFDKNASDTIVIEVDSLDDGCLIVSVQDSRCPVLDTNKDVKYEGTYQTVTRKGAITITKRKYPLGFFLVFVARPDNYKCSQENSIIPQVQRMSYVLENNISTTITFLIRDSISVKDYLIACIGTMMMVAIFGITLTGIIFVLNRFGTISKMKDGPIKVKDVIEPLTIEEKRKIVLSEEVTVNMLAKYPGRIKQRSFNYFSHTASIALFYSIPVIQLVVTYQRMVNVSGNQDLCYYNFMCTHPALGFSDFNHIYSNIAYMLIGLFFLIAVLDRQHRIKITKDKGIPVHYGLFYAMGLALTIEGILSGCYHICPSQSNYQFDTSFMYVMAVLMMVKLYQNRHPDINATAYSTFTVVGFAIFIAMIGILNGSLFIWIAFLVSYAILIMVLSLKIYYFNMVVVGVQQFYSKYQQAGLCLDTFHPIRKGRFIILCLANLANFAILGMGIYIYMNNVTDFGTFLLGLLLANTVLHTSFYTVMKLIHKEKISYEAIIFGACGMACWITSGIFFLDAATLWTVTPAESRQWNQGCIFLGFYDKHDVWHLLSAPALYFTFLYLMYLDDDLCDKPQNQIPVF
ncbi:SID1 transmembrane family member 1-like [Anthonomus grandis grandis]|uniref:SID1 transmembrane family member 1-like n=1 Tax=Anthonomus grandis grandis TaxID=2921223 RepID=UPI0021662A80|nr:SID1 transmembrane family member 1-like [Anthonomus grandis grandis]